MPETLTSCIFAGGRATRLYPHTLRPSNQKPLLLMGSSDRRLIDFSLEISAVADHSFVFTNHDPIKSEEVEAHISMFPNVIPLMDKKRSRCWIFTRLLPNSLS
jgi:CTP:molybdopterin cytidylyltransferase MocA